MRNATCIRQMLSFVLCVFVMLPQNSRSSATEVSDIIDACPYSNFCASNTSRGLDDSASQSCCLPCSCRSDCGIIGKCCPDAEQSSAFAEVYPCRSQVEIYTSYRNNQNWQTLAGNMYRIIDGCPTEAFGDLDLTESVSRCYNAREIEDLSFVTASGSGFTYLNKHCAICNHDVVFSSWSLYLIDLRLFSQGMSFEERDRRILKNGGVVSVPPTSEMALLALCDANTLKECNATGNWDFYDRDLDMKCRTTNGEYIQERFGQTFIFANVYCFLCNNPKGTPIPSLCKNRATYTDDVRDGGIVFVALLLPQPREEPRSACAVGDTLDPFQMRCTQLFCPTGSVPRNGDCVRMFDDVIGYDLSVEMKVVFDDKTDVTSIDNYDGFMDDMTSLFKKTLYRGKIRCLICDMNLYLHRPSGTWYVQSALRTGKSCSFTDLLRGLNILFNKTSVNVYLPKTQLSVTLIINANNESTSIDTDQMETLDYKYFTDMYCSHMNSFYFGAVYCPSIQLTSEDMKDLAGFENVKHLLMSKSVDVGNDTLKLCLENYISILKSAQSVSGIQQNGSIIIVNICLLFTFSIQELGLKLYKFRF